MTEATTTLTRAASDFMAIITALANDQPLAEKHRNHALTGDWQLPVSNHFVLPRCNKEAQIMEILLDVVAVEAKPDYKLYLEFENGERRIFDMSPYMDKKPFSRLKGSPLFTKASIDYGTVVWPGEIDIAPETLYDRSQPA